MVSISETYIYNGYTHFFIDVSAVTKPFSHIVIDNKKIKICEVLGGKIGHLALDGEYNLDKVIEVE